MFNNHKLNIEINKKKPDDATLERLTAELIETGYLQKAVKLSDCEKGFRFIAILFTIGGIFCSPIMEVAIGFWIIALMQAIGLELHMRKIRKFCEDNS